MSTIPVVTSALPLPEVSTWEMSLERKVRSALSTNRAQVFVVAGALGDAMLRVQAAFPAAEWAVWSARHVGRRVVMP